MLSVSLSYVDDRALAELIERLTQSAQPPAGYLIRHRYDTCELRCGLARSTYQVIPNPIRLKGVVVHNETVAGSAQADVRSTSAVTHHLLDPIQRLQYSFMRVSPGRSRVLALVSYA